MPWYKIKVRCGGGHQSKGLSYRYEAEPLEKGHRYRQEYFERVCDGEHWNNAIGTVTMVHGLPREVVEQKLTALQWEENEIEKMRRVLHATPMLKGRKERT